MIFSSLLVFTKTNYSLALALILGALQLCYINSHIFLHILLFSDRSCKIGVMDPHLYVAGLPPSNEIMATGHTLRFLCSNTRVLIGSTEIECLENGQWNSPFPTCSGMCTFITTIT